MDNITICAGFSVTDAGSSAGLRLCVGGATAGLAGEAQVLSQNQLSKVYSLTPSKVAKLQCAAPDKCTTATMLGFSDLLSTVQSRFSDLKPPHQCLYTIKRDHFI